MVASVLVWITYCIDLLGVGIICFGIIHACWAFLRHLFLHVPLAIDTMRLNLGRTIVLAVEFLLAADIVKTIITPDYYEIGMLGALVIIRTILTYFLNQELEQLQ